MGILTDVGTEYDNDNEEIIITAVTRGQLNTRAALTRVSGRVATGTGLGARTLVAAAYDELGIDVVWNQGLGVTIPLEEKYPKAQEIEYYNIPIERASEFGDITGIATERIPNSKLRDLVGEGIDTYLSGTTHIHVWKIPYEVAGR